MKCLYVGFALVNWEKIGGVFFLFGWSERQADSFVHKPIHRCDYYMADIRNTWEGGRVGGSSDSQAVRHEIQNWHCWHERKNRLALNNICKEGINAISYLIGKQDKIKENTESSHWGN